MHATFLIGPAGTGKTFRCLAEARAAIKESPDGLPLLFLAPKQATFQLERELLSDPDLHGYARLQILSFERLARFVLGHVAAAAPRLLSEEGRVMVLRALLGEHLRELRIFHASAQLPGFAHQLSATLDELQRHQVSPKQLLETAEAFARNLQLAGKLHDLAIMLREYKSWLARNDLHDPGSLLDLAADSIATLVRSEGFRCTGLWLDGFAQLTPQELALLLAILPGCERATLAFCAQPPLNRESDWLSQWNVPARTASDCIEAVRGLSNSTVSIEIIARDTATGRFRNSPPLAHLERSWDQPEPFTLQTREHLRLWSCANAETEVTAAAHEILQFVRNGARFRQTGLLLRSLAGYHDVIRRVFARYEIPFFVDRREPVSHHPLPELTRSALRVAVFDWQLEDWFAALKTGLVCDEESNIDALEVEARSRGWSGRTWCEPFREPGLHAQEETRQKTVQPFLRFVAALHGASGEPSGEELTDALGTLWDDLGVTQTLETWSAETDDAFPAVHVTVWDHMQAWLEDLRLAFGQQRRSLRDWLGIVESGLSNLTVGVVPPALDQVMVGAVDRSRNPNLDLVIVSGLNETVFPAPPERPLLLNESDRAALEGKHFPGMNSRSALGYERFLGYIAMTRARHRLVLTWSAYDPTDSKLNPSSFIGHVRRLFPQLEVNEFRTAGSWIDAEHLRELAPTLLGPEQQGLDQITASPTLAAFRERLRRFRGFSTREELSPEVAARLYGRELCTSVTSLERFAACPFKFFVHSGLRAQERKLFEVDQRKVGDFQHQVLKAFHEEITANGLRWRDVQPTEARKRISIIAERLAATFSHGLFTASPRQRFAVHQLSRALQDFIEVIVGWMAQYEFDPVAVELRFHDGGDVPPWRLQLGGEQALAFTGSIDRVDMLKLPDGTALCVVVDYKSSSRRIDALLLANGIQLQLPAYLSVLRHCAHTKDRFNVERFIPAGVFYVSLKGDYKRGTHRDAVLAEAADARRVAYRHFGCFDASRLKHLDNNPWMVDEPFRGEQFNFKTTKSGDLHKSFPDAMESAEFSNLLDNIEDQLRNMGRRIFTGEAALDPYRHNSFVACDHCDYQSICRIDRWTHVYRALKEAP